VIGFRRFRGSRRPFRRVCAKLGWGRVERPARIKRSIVKMDAKYPSTAAVIMATAELTS
jgi:hypothetical protein